MTSVEQPAGSEATGRAWRVTAWLSVVVHLVVLPASIHLARVLNGERLDQVDDDTGAGTAAWFGMVLMIGFAVLAVAALLLLVPGVRGRGLTARSRSCIGLGAAAALLEVVAGVALTVLVVTIS